MDPLETPPRRSMYRDDETYIYYSVPIRGVSYIEEEPRSRSYIPATTFLNPAGDLPERRYYEVPNALYRLYGADELLYIGITRHPAQRWISHSISKSWWGEVEAKVVEWYPDRSLAEIAEYLAIQREDPLYNRDRKPPRAWRRLNEEGRRAMAAS